MADSFFGFGTTITHDEDCGDEIETDEQEYDALNDETFGDIDESTGVLDDWESQHEQLAEITESARKNTDHAETPIEDYLDPLKHMHDEVFDKAGGYNAWVDEMEKLFSPTKEQQVRKEKSPNVSSVFNQCKLGPQSNGITLPRNVCTVEELEKSLLTSSSTSRVNMRAMPPKMFPPNYTQAQASGPPMRYPPPGLGPMFMPPQYLPAGVPPPPPGMLRFIPPHPILMPQGVRPMPQPVGQHKNHPGPPNMHPGIRGNYPGQQNNYNFRHDYQTQNMPPPPPFNSNLRPYHPNNQHLYNRNSNMNRGPQKPRQMEPHDEYANLMTSREKQWLLNIQMLQVNTGTPYFDDYYYTVYTDRQAKLEKENRPNVSENSHYQRGHQNNWKDGHRDRDRNNRGNRNDNRDNNQTQINRVYTPLQFENSLGKLQFGSVIAPRKIIDMDIVPHESETGQPGQSTQRDVRRTKQVLLELESLFALVLRLEDLNNPLAIANLLKLREIKEKQKIQQLESATPEEKIEILKELQEDSLVKTDNREDLLSKILTGLLLDDKFSSYVAIRKGKILLLRLLPHLTYEMYSTKLIDVWVKLLASIPLIGKRDTLGDNILPQYFHYFERFMELCDMDVVVTLTSKLLDIKTAELSRVISHGKPILFYILSNRFGVSCVGKLIEKSESAFCTSSVTDQQKTSWFQFVRSLSEALAIGDLKAESPLQPLGRQLFETHVKRAALVDADRYTLFYNVFCDKV